MSSYGTSLHDRILQVGQQDVRYMEIVHKLQQGVGTGTSGNTCTCSNTYTSTGADAQRTNYCLTVDGLVRFRDKIYVLDNGELKKVILREFHVKPYSSHPSYQNTLTIVKIFYY